MNPAPMIFFWRAHIKFRIRIVRGGGMRAAATAANSPQTRYKGTNGLSKAMIRYWKAIELGAGASVILVNVSRSG